MRWLLHGNPTAAAAEALRRHGHQTFEFAALGASTEAPPGEILKAAVVKQWDVLTTNSELIETLYREEIAFPRTIVYLQLPGGDVEQDDAIDRLFERYQRLTPKRLYTVTETRVKVRQLPGN